ncbi:hypothetical protein PC128_g11018 [Phytophthora cactorum]|nr:hypothetical protein PC128_g11018 [Phytophthora cactorum]
MDPGKYAVARAIKSIQEAEFAVSSGITVREEYKAKLRALLSIIAPTTLSTGQPICGKPQVFTKSKSKKTTHTGFQVPEGKEIHVLGDLLLLTRAASVDVVENIQEWRKIVHEGIPRPYIYDQENYLLRMCEDLDFLDRVGDLVEWLGFRLLRNPFIVDKALDDIVSSRLEISVRDDRWLKYWSSASWHQNLKLSSKKDTVLNSSKPLESQSTPTIKARWKKQPPPQPLVKPLVSISPEDGVVDGSRIAAAQQILLDEESFHGRLLALKAVQEYVDRGPSILKRCEVGNNVEPPAVYDAIAALNAQQKTAEYRSSLLRQERAQVECTLRDLRNQMRWTELNRDCDRTRDHRVRPCRDMYRQEVLKLYAKLIEEMEHCLAVLKGGENHFDGLLDKCKCRMSELRVEKEKQRVIRHNKKTEEETSRRDGIRKKTEEGPGETNNTTNDIAADIESDILVIVEKKSSIPVTNGESPETIYHQLEEKRQRMVYLKRSRLEQQARTAKENEHVLDSRRAENVGMKREDTLSRIVELEAKRKAQLRAQKEIMNQVASCAMFKCMHEMNGKRFLISVYTRNARGYDLEGLRIVAYDPSTSATFTLVMTFREFNSLGDADSSDLSGLGRPALHLFGYSFVAVYLRTDDLSTYRRLHAIKELIAHAGAIAPEALELIYHGYCERCAMLVPPIVLVLGSALSSSMIVSLLPLLEHYFTSFDSNKNGFLHFQRSDGHTIAEEGLHARGALLLALARDQVVVLFNASCGVTVGSANVFVHELHWWLYPDHHDLSCHVAYVVGDANDVNSEARDHRDYDLLEALQALNYAACQIAELDPVRLDDGDNEESDHASAFDAYLVAEAVLVEATRVILHPDYSWQKPREIIGASSWSSACSFLLEPTQLSAHLQQCNPLQLDAATVEVLDAYFTHAKWPHDYPDVRPFFYGLLAFMMHLQHVRHILALRNGSLQSSLQRVARDEIATEHEQLAKNTSVIDCTHLGHMTETPS